MTETFFANQPFLCGEVVGHVSHQIPVLHGSQNIIKYQNILIDFSAKRLINKKYIFKNIYPNGPRNYDLYFPLKPDPSIFFRSNCKPVKVKYITVPGFSVQCGF